MFQAEKSALASALSAIKPAINSRNVIPILGNVLVERDAANLVLTGTTLDLQISARLPAAFEESFEPFTVPFEPLSQAVRNMAGAIRVEKVEHGNALTAVNLKAGRARIKLPTLSAKDFPTLDAKAMPHTIGLGAASLAKALAATAPMMCTEAQREFLCGVFMDPAADGLRLVALNGHYMSVRLIPPTDLDEPVAGLPAVIIPADTVRALAKLPADGNATIRYGEHKIEADCGNVVLRSKLVDGTYPDYVRLRPADRTTSAKVECEPLDAAVARVLTVAAESKTGRCIRFVFDDLGVTVSTRPGEDGDAEDAVSADVTGKGVTIGFNGQYIRDIVAAAPEKTLVVELDQPGSPALLHPVDNEDNFFVLMPMRV